MNTPQINEHIFVLIAKCYTEECSEKEQKELTDWKEQSSENSTLFNETAAVLADTKNALSAARLKKIKAFSNITAKLDKNETIAIERKRKAKRLNIMLRVAAAVALLIAISVAYLYHNHNPSHITTIKTAQNEIRQITLPDGSNVVVNGNTTISFPENFNGPKRDIVLSGEAFFNVKPDKEHPFVISTGNVEVKVLGTSFNVKAYKEKNETLVVVVSGTVQVSTNNKKITITKGEAALFTKNKGTLKSYKNKDINFKAWKTKQIRFKNTTLKNALTTLENTYRINIEIKDSNIIRNKKINADFDRQSVDFILNTICETYHLSYTKNGNNYLITGKK